MVIFWMTKDRAVRVRPEAWVVCTFSLGQQGVIAASAACSNGVAWCVTVYVCVGGGGGGFVCV